jgi:hypothetical protein
MVHARRLSFWSASSYPTKTSFNRVEASVIETDLDLHAQIDKHHSAENLPLLREG